MATTRLADAGIPRCYRRGISPLKAWKKYRLALNRLSEQPG